MTQGRQFTSYDDLFLASTNQAELGVVTLLAWVAVCDGQTPPEEMETLRQLAGNSDIGAELEAAIEFARPGKIGDLQLACEVVRQLPEDRRKRVLVSAVVTALADGVLRIPEIHVLRFLADLLGFGLEVVNEIFLEITACELPSPGDPSRIEWWQEREGRSRRRSMAAEPDDEEATNGAEPWGPAGLMDRPKALAVLGLEEDATGDEIREAYRRLARIHHPDKFAALGPEATRVATVTFQRIQAAYQRLAKP